MECKHGRMKIFRDHWELDQDALDLIFANAVCEKKGYYLQVFTDTKQEDILWFKPCMKKAGGACLVADTERKPIRRKWRVQCVEKAFPWLVDWMAMKGTEGIVLAAVNPALQGVTASMEIIYGEAEEGG